MIQKTGNLSDDVVLATLEEVRDDMEEEDEEEDRPTSSLSSSNLILTYS